MRPLAEGAVGCLVYSTHDAPVASPETHSWRNIGVGVKSMLGVPALCWFAFVFVQASLSNAYAVAIVGFAVPGAGAFLVARKGRWPWAAALFASAVALFVCWAILELAHLQVALDHSLS
jgi:hypothetical protein